MANSQNQNNPGCSRCRGQRETPLPDDDTDEFIISDGAIWYCGEGNARGIAINYCPWCGRQLKEDYE